MKGKKELFQLDLLFILELAERSIRESQLQLYAVSGIRIWWLLGCLCKSSKTTSKGERTCSSHHRSIKPCACPTTMEVFWGPFVSVLWKMNAPESDCKTGRLWWVGIRGCWMYKDSASQGLVWCFDGFLWATGENSANRTTVRTAKETAVQNMILGSIMHSQNFDMFNLIGQSL